MKTIKNLLIFICIIFSLGILSSCGENESEPKNLIDESTMVNILIKTHLAEARVITSGISSDSAVKIYQIFQNKILADYKVSKEKYDQSYQYYIKNINKMDQIYAHVVDSLSLREAIKKID